MQEVVEVHVQNFIKLSAAVHELSTVQCTRFRTTLDFDRNYRWNGSSNRQAENAVINYYFSTFDENNSLNFGPLTTKMTFTYDLEIQHYYYNYS